MNERIEELAVAAAPANSSIPHSEWNIPKEFIEKFAELIVWECVGIVEGLSPGYNDYRNQIEDAFRSDCVEEIKQHFGVEEC